MLRLNGFVRYIDRYKPLHDPLQPARWHLAFLFTHRRASSRLAVGFRSAIALSVWRQFKNGLTHFLARLELDYGPPRNRNIGFRLIWVPSDARFAHFDFKDAEITQFDGLAGSNGGGDVVESLLHHIQDLLLNEARFFTDADYEITFCHNAWFCALTAYDMQHLAQIPMSLKHYSRRKRRSSRECGNY
jgi:hypothetical protein